MANQILRPSADGHYTGWTPSSGGTIYDKINEADADGDASYVTASAASTFTTDLSAVMAGAWPRATRVCSIRIVATVRTVVTESVYKVRLRILGNDYDSATRAVNVSSKYIEQDEVYVLTPNAYAWDLMTLSNMEVGLVFSSGDPIRCTKLEVFLHYEPFPHHTLAPEGNGVLQDWSPNPSGSPAYMTVGGVFDGDLSYLEDTTVNNRSTFETADLPAALSPANIDRVSVKGLVKNAGAAAEHADIVVYSAGNYFNGGTNTTSVSLPADDEWYLLSEDFLNDPGTVWPSGDPAASAWTDTQVNGIEVGVENAGGGDFRCTSLAAEVWLAPTYPTTIDLLPSADGYHTDWTNIVPSAPAWGTVDEDPPDDITSYVSLDADTAETPVYASFDVAGAGSVPAGERIYNVELRCRVRLDNLPHSQATVVPVMRDTSGTAETFVGKPQLIEGIGSTWIDVKWDFHNNPHTGAPWASLSEVNTAMEYGMGVLDGQMLLSRVRAQVQTIADYRGVSDVTDLRITDIGEYWMNRAKADGTIYGYWEFGVGIGGYDVTDPTVVTAVDPGDTALLNEVYRTGVGRIEYDSLTSPPTVDFWCRVPQDEGIGGIGEIGLYAQILWSPVPAEIGTWFLFAIAHMPCQTRTQNWSNVHFYRLQVSFNDYGANLLVDGDMEFIGSTLLTDGDMEDTGTSAWTVWNSATLTKETGSPHGGLRSLRTAYNGTNNPGAQQPGILTTGKSYRVLGWGAGDGTYVPRVYLGSSEWVFTGTSSTSWQEFNEPFVANTTTVFFHASATAAGYAEFDDLIVRSDTPDWTEQNNALLSKETSAYEGTYCLRVTYDGTNYPMGYQTVLTAGVLYWAHGWARGDGSIAPSVEDTGTTVWTGTSSTSWQEFDFLFVATGTTFYLKAEATGIGYVEFDDATVRAVLSYDFLIHGAELVVDNDMEAVGVAAWTAGNSAALTKETTDPYEGTQVLRITYNTVNNPYAEQSVLVIGTIYHAIGRMRSDGTGVPALYDGATLLWTGTTSVSWQYFSVAFEATSTDIRYWCGITAAGYCEVDLVSCKAITPA